VQSGSAMGPLSYPPGKSPLLVLFKAARIRLRADIANADSLYADDLPRQQSSEAFVPRLQIDMTALDLRIQERIAKYGSIKDFHVLLWRDEPDATGCNWNARIDRVRDGSSDSSWWSVVPQMRECFNLM
jgi:hypothetical protein